MLTGNLKYPILILVAVGLAIASIDSDEAGALVHDHSTHTHGASLTDHPRSPLENKLQQAVAAETGFEMTGHEASEGPTLMTNKEEHIRELFNAHGCPAIAPVKEYNVVAIRVTLVLNRWGDRDPEAYIFALSSRVIGPCRTNLPTEQIRSIPNMLLRHLWLEHRCDGIRLRRPLHHWYGPPRPLAPSQRHVYRLPVHPFRLFPST